MEETSGQDYHRSSYTGYGEDPEIHQRELERRVVMLHEIYDPPVYSGDTKFGHVHLGGSCFGVVLVSVYHTIRGI